MVPRSGQCSQHPGRAGIGVCVECRRVVCAECSTQFEGINRCAQCLAKRLAAAGALPSRNDWTVKGVLLALAATALLCGSVYFAARLLLGGGRDAVSLGGSPGSPGRSS